MTSLSRLLSIALAATSVAALGVSTANAAVAVRPAITITPVRPAIPAVHPVVAAPRPVTTLQIGHAASLPVIHAPLPATHAPVPPATHASTTPASSAPADHWMPGGSYVLPANHVALPPHATSSVAAVLGGKPVIKGSYVNGNGTTVYYLSKDAQHIVGVISSISDAPQPATHVPPQNGPVPQPANQPATQPSSSKPAAGSGQTVTETPVSYQEITDAYGRPMGYVNAQGQAVYFPNGQMPAGFTVGPNHKIQTYISSTSTPAPASKPAQAPQQPSSSKPAANSGQRVTETPVSYPEITDVGSSDGLCQRARSGGLLPQRPHAAWFLARPEPHDRDLHQVVT
jgi:hypothetical protein